VTEGSGIREQGTGNREQGTGNREQGTADPLTRLAAADDDAVANHPLPQGGEGCSRKSGDEGWSF